MALITKEQIVAAKDTGRQTLRVPMWGGDVLLQALNAKQHSAFEAESLHDGKVDMSNMKARYCAKVLILEDGQRMFTDAEADLLGEKSAAAINLIWDKASAMNGMSDADLEELSKNSIETESDD